MEHLPQHGHSLKTAKPKSMPSKHSNVHLLLFLVPPLPAQLQDITSACHFSLQEAAGP